MRLTNYVNGEQKAKLRQWLRINKIKKSISIDLEEEKDSVLNLNEFEAKKNQKEKEKIIKSIIDLSRDFDPKIKVGEIRL